MAERKPRAARAAAGTRSAFIYPGRAGRAGGVGGAGGLGEERAGEEESSSRSGWKGTGVSAVQGAPSQGDGAKDGAEQLRSRERVSSRRTSRRREGLREERPTCGSKMHPTQLEMRSKLQFHSRRKRGASD